MPGSCVVPEGGCAVPYLDIYIVPLNKTGDQNSAEDLSKQSVQAHCVSAVALKRLSHTERFGIRDSALSADPGVPFGEGCIAPGTTARATDHAAAALTHELDLQRPRVEQPIMVSSADPAG